MSTAAALTPGAAGRARPAGGVLRALAFLALTGAVAVAAWVAWQLWGTTAVASSQARTEVAAFTGAHPVDTARVAVLRTDFVADPPPVVDMPASGTWGLLHVPAWAGQTGSYGEALKAAVPIASGTSEAVLNRAWAGHFEGSAAPGQVGNFALAGHRRSYGQNFRHVADLEHGDVLVVETGEAWFVFEVAGPAETVTPDAVVEVAGNPHPDRFAADGRLITLTTCTSTSVGEWGNDHRLAVHAVLTGWAPHDAGVPAVLRGGMER